MLIKIIGESLLISALILFAFVVYEYQKHNKELNNEIENFLQEHRSYMAEIAEWQTRTAEDTIWG